MSKDSFKLFVKNNPNLVNYINDGSMTWQKFYELYDLYGEDDKIWLKYLNNNSNNDNFNFKNIIDLFKGIDLKTVQKTLTGLDKAVGAFKEFNSDKINNNNNIYNERPNNRIYED